VGAIYSFKAVIFDLDGVITQTAGLHSNAWKKMFDEYLKDRESIYGEPFREFTYEKDYLSFVDGKPRYEGVQSFLKSRNIEIPYGNPDDSDDKETVCGLGNRKNSLINQLLNEQGVTLFSSTIHLIQDLRQNGIKVGVASSSKNCKHVLEVANISHLFDTRVDGITVVEQNLKGKPAPDIFLKACENLKVPYFQAAVVEDAVSGVQAGRNGRFGLIIGIARAQNHQILKENGADIVVSDLKEIDIQFIEHWFTIELPKKLWKYEINQYTPENERTYESLFAVGNGYFGSRGINVENTSSKYSYPGTYIAGVYNHLDSIIEGKVISNEDLVNLPNWLFLTFKHHKKEYFDLNSYTFSQKNRICEYSRGIDLKRGVSYRDLIIEENTGEKTYIHTEIFASADNPHIGTLTYSIKPLNYSDRFLIKSRLDGNVRNEGVERYKSFQNQHLTAINVKGGDDWSLLSVKTNNSNILVVEIAKLDVTINSQRIEVKWNHKPEKLHIDSEFSCNLNENDTLTVNKTVVFFTNQSYDSVDPLKQAKKTLNSVKSYSELLNSHINQWNYYWNQINLQIKGDRFVQQALRLHSYHLLSTSSLISSNFNFGIPARGLTGESYHGHIFWDEIFIIPFYNLFFPEISRSLLLYRYYCLPNAKKNAQTYNYRGAMFPWQSASNGAETTQKFHFNPKSGKWDPDFSYLQKHVSLAIAFNIWRYFEITSDYDFFLNYGAEIFFEIVKFWVSAAKFNEKTQKYDISKVMGPDEFHEKFPESQDIGLKNNFYTNIMVSWLLDRAKSFIESLNKNDKRILISHLNIMDDDLQIWGIISRNLSLSINEEGIIEQFEGYFHLKELDWDKYKEKYRDISRLDRILKAEGLSTDFFKVSKQPDVLIVFFLLNKRKIKDLLIDLGFPSYEDILVKNFEYYFSRTSHGSTLSKIVFSNLANQIGQFDRKKQRDKKILSWNLFQEALGSDIFDIQGGTTKEGIHTGVMAATVTELIRSYCGFQLIQDQIFCRPNLPNNIEQVQFNAVCQGTTFTFIVSNLMVKIRINMPQINQKFLMIEINHQKIEVSNQKWTEIEL